MSRRYTHRPEDLFPGFNEAVIEETGGAGRIVAAALNEGYAKEIVEGLNGDYATSQWLMGIGTGWEEAAKWLREMSGTAYASGRNDAKAELLRQLAEEADAVAVERRRAYAKHLADYLPERATKRDAARGER